MRKGNIINVLDYPTHRLPGMPPDTPLYWAYWQIQIGHAGNGNWKWAAQIYHADKHQQLDGMDGMSKSEQAVRTDSQSWVKSRMTEYRRP